MFAGTKATMRFLGSTIEAIRILPRGIHSGDKDQYGEMVLDNFRRRAATFSSPPTSPRAGSTSRSVAAVIV